MLHRLEYDGVNLMRHSILQPSAIGAGNHLVPNKQAENESRATQTKTYKMAP